MAVDNPDISLKNPNCCASAFGRIFYAVDSTIFFSQVLVTAADAGRCYQNNDPTSEEIPDLLDTDGGVVTLEESVKIKAIKPFKSGILIFATNGVWYMYNPDGGFKATAFNISKVSERGVESPRSIVEAEGSVYYFSNNGIILISASEFDVLASDDISENTLRSYFLERHAGKKAQGLYDEPNKQVVWYNPDEEGYGLILDLQAGGFYPQQQQGEGWRTARPFKVDNAVFYPCWKPASDDSNIDYVLAQPVDETFEDFSTPTTGFLLSGWEALGKFANRKRAPRAKVYFNKTETQVTGYADGEYTYDSPSGCLFQSRWDYDISDTYGKWTGVISGSGKGKTIQLYQPMQRGFIPSEFPCDFDTGERVIKRLTGIRGSGDAVQFMFEAEPNKDMKLLGYSVTYDMGARM